MTDRPLRFGVVAAAAGTADEWRATARRVEELGYSTLVSPDGLQLLSTLPALAVAGSVTTTLRVGTFVLAAPLRPPRLAAWDAHTLSVLLDGRFECGVGTGHAEVVRQAAERLDRPSTGADRLAWAGQTIDELRELDGAGHTPVMVAAAGPKAMALAAEKADIVALALGPLAGRAGFREAVDNVRRQAGARADDIEISSNVWVVGDEVPQWIQGFIGADAATLIEHDSLSMLRGTTRQMADEIRRRRDELGISYTTVNSASFEQFAPVVELLSGE